MKLVFALLIAAVPTGAFSQTAEETAAFIIEGIEDGVQRNGKKFIQESSSPARFLLPVDKPVRFSFQATGACSFAYEDSTEGGPITKATIDFSKFRGIVTDEGVNTLDLGPSCALYVNGNCENKITVHVEKYGSLKRLEGAISYFKSRFCPGWAY